MLNEQKYKWHDRKQCVLQKCRGFAIIKVCIVDTREREEGKEQDKKYLLKYGVWGIRSRRVL